MTVETDTLAEAALRFSEAIRAERASTFDALAAERQAALKIIEALKAERARGTRAAGARFVIGVALGVAAGVAAIYFVSQRASEEARLGLTAAPAPALSDGDAIRERIKLAIEDGKRAARSHEDELWQRYRERITEAPQPPRPDELFS